MAPELTRLGDSNQIRVTINWRDHDPPHFHVEIKGKMDATVGIESLAIEDGSLPQGRAGPRSQVGEKSPRRVTSGVGTGVPPYAPR